MGRREVFYFLPPFKGPFFLKQRDAGPRARRCCTNDRGSGSGGVLPFSYAPSAALSYKKLTFNTTTRSPKHNFDFLFIKIFIKK
jgi:hypothetical protein